ncbi:MAG TPA: hypothetical protein VKS79_16600, partial [Gemmataceae bacterium]|nr:hypothetical protein [Gemmataceae bacterium]
MPSIIACPGCQNQLKIGKPFSGRKCRCPSCRTNFVLGNSPKAGEFLAFEVFDEGDQNNAGAQNGQSRDNSRGFGDKESIPVDFNLQLDILPQKDNEKFLSTDISVFEQPPATKPQAPAEKKPPVINMELPGATRPIQPPAKPTQKPPAKPEVRPSPPPPVERKPEPKPPAKSGANKIPRIPGPSKPPLPVSKPPALPPPPVHVSSDSSIDFKPIVPEIVREIVPPLELEPPEENVAPPIPPLELQSPNETAIPSLPPPLPAKEVDEDYFLPKDYEIT